MTELLDAVADLTDLRDQDDMESALAMMMFVQLDAAALRLWRVVHRDGRTCLRRRVALPETGEAGADFTENAELALEDMPAELRTCHDTKAELCRTGADGRCRHVFPLCDGRNVVCLIEVLCPGPLCESQTHIISGLLRIYCNHLGILNFSDRDELTGLLNRRTFSETFKRIALRVSAEVLLGDAPSKRRRVVARFHLAVIDIDFFKRINDQFGHPYGDEVLVLLARLIVECFRDTDWLFRFGGEEFLVILPDTDPAEAEAALERFRAEVAAFRFSQLDRVTVSIGFTEILAGDTGADAFGRADRALYVAKHRGRNQVQCYEWLVAHGALASAAGNEQEVELF